jgi:hypothetical protein
MYEVIKMKFSYKYLELCVFIISSIPYSLQPFIHLKVLSSEMDQAKIMLIRLYKRNRRVGVLAKFARPLSIESPLTQGRHLVE